MAIDFRNTVDLEGNLRVLKIHPIIFFLKCIKQFSILPARCAKITNFVKHLI